MWTQKYRPKKLDDMVLPKRVMDELKSKPFSNYLFHGTPGTGKTTAALAMAHGGSFLKITPSLEDGIDMIRSKIVKFASQMEYDNSIKLVIIDDVDFLSLEDMRVLRGAIEEFEETTRFVFTSNQKDSIITAVGSRVIEMCFDFSGSERKEQLDGYEALTQQILGENNMTITTDVMFEIFNEDLPDYRYILNRLQQQHGMGETAVTVDDKPSCDDKQSYDYERMAEVITRAFSVPLKGQHLNGGGPNSGDAT